MFEYIGLGAKFMFSSEGIDQVDGIVTRLRTLETQFRTSGAGAREFGGAMQNMGTALMSSGLVTTLAGIAQGYATLNGIMSAADWESNMMDAIKYMDDDSVEKQKAYNEAITETAIQLGKTREEINKATISYMQMGKSVDDAIRLAKNASFAATTWDMDAEQVAKSFRVMKSSLEVDMEDQNIFTDITNQINEVGNRTAATSKNVVELIQYAGAALHQTGKASIQDIMAMASAAAYANIPMGEFGTAMNTMMNRYVKDGGKYFGKLGVEVKNAAGEMRPFMDVIDEVAVKWKTLTSTQREEFLSGFGMHHASRLGAFIGANSEFHKAKDQVIPNTPADSAQKEYERVTDTFNNKWQSMMTSIKALTQTIFTPLMKALQPIIQGITKVSEVLRNMTMNNEGLATLVSGFITLSTVAVLAVGGAMLLSGALFKLNGLFVAGAFKTNIFTKALEAVRITMRNLSPQFLMLKNSLGPLILQFAKFAGMSAVLYGVWKYDLFGIKSLFTDFFENLKIEFGKIQTLLKADISVEGFKQGLYDMQKSGTALDTVGAQIVRFGILWQALCEGWSTYKLSPDMKAKLENAGLLRAWELIMMTKVRIEALFEGIKKGFKETFEFVGDIVKKCLAPIALFVIDYIINPIANALGYSADTVEWFSNAIKGNLKDNKQDWIDTGSVIGKVLGGVALFKFVGMVGRMVSAVKKYLGLLKSIVTGAFNLLASPIKFIGNLFTKIPALVGRVIPMISSFGAAITGVLTTIGTIATSVLAAFGVVVSAPAWLVGAIVVAIGAAITAIIVYRDEICEFFSGLWDTICKFFTEDVPQAFNSFADNVGEVFSNLPYKIGYGLGYLAGIVWNFFTETIPQAFTWFVGKVGEMAESVGRFFTETIPQALSTLGNILWNFFTETIPQAFAWLINTTAEACVEFCRYMVEDFPQALQNFSVSLWNFFMIDVPNAFTEFCNNVYNSAIEFGKYIIDGIVDGINNFEQTCFDAFDSFAEGLKQGFKDAMGINSPSKVFMEYGQFICEGLKNGIDNFKNGAVSAISGVANSIKETAMSTVNKGLEWGSNMIGNLSDGIINTKDRTVQAILSITSSIAEKVLDLINRGIAYGSELINNIASGISSAVGAVISAVSGITSSISNVLGGVVDNAFSWGKNMAKGFGDGISAMSSYIGGKANSIMLNVSDYLGFHSPSKKGEGQHIVEWGSNMVKGFADGVIDKRDYLSDIISTLIKPISGVIDVSPKVSTLSDEIKPKISASSDEEKPKISNGYLSDVKQSLSEAKRNVSETISNVSTRSINIANGAIQNHFTINGGENPQDIANYILRVLDENLMRMLEDKMLEAYARTNS